MEYLLLLYVNENGLNTLTSQQQQGAAGLQGIPRVRKPAIQGQQPARSPLRATTVYREQQSQGLAVPGRRRSNPGLPSH
jgi:hypothetical protein